MKAKTYGVGGFCLVLLAIMPATRVQAFDDLESMCQTQASVAMHVSRSDVKVRRSDNLDDGSGNYILLWEARLHHGAHSRATVRSIRAASRSCALKAVSTPVDPGYERSSNIGVSWQP